MVRYISVDAGKSATKAAEFLLKENKVNTFTFKTKISPGDFRDDAIETDTYIAGFGKNIFKIGNGARGTGTDLETSKQSMSHRIATLYAIAHFCSDNEMDEINVAVGLPAKDWAVVNKRESFKDYLFNEKEAEEFEVVIKESSNAKPVHKRFKVKKSFVFPESIGALFMDDSPIGDTTPVGVLDLGNLNLNATIWMGTDLIQDDSITDELGGACIIQGLSQELTANFSRVDERFVSYLMQKNPEERFLVPKNGDEQVKEASKRLIKEYLLEHARKIKRCCDGRKWSLDYMQLIAIGGTSIMIKDELKAIFGENITILSNPTFANAYGFLRILCQRMPEIGEVIDLPTGDADNSTSEPTNKSTKGKNNAA